jgi:hypothetical protein
MGDPGIFSDLLTLDFWLYFAALICIPAGLYFAPKIALRVWIWRRAW